jgi:hemoglobin
MMRGGGSFLIRRAAPVRHNGIRQRLVAITARRVQIQHVSLPQMSLYDQVGGEPTFLRLADDFYHRIDGDTRLRAMFPADLSGARERLALFLIQYFGGPSTYSEQRGHPRLRMRHLPFAIGARERDIWVGHMLASIDSVGIPEPARTHMIEYFERGATFMINQDQPAAG